jgi:hypothetical protein
MVASCCCCCLVIIQPQQLQIIQQLIKRHLQYRMTMDRKYSKISVLQQPEE